MKPSFVLHVLSVVFMLCFFIHCAGSSSHSQLESTVTDNFPEGENVIPLDSSSTSSVTAVSNENFSGTITTGSFSLIVPLENDSFIMQDSFFQLQDQSGELK